jgi:hypothetical protein
MIIKEEIQMEEKRISVQEFDVAVKKVVEDMMADTKLEGMAKLTVPLIGTMFASNMEKVLFADTKEECKND